MKDSFVIYTKYDEQISLLSDEQAGKLLRALLKYQSGLETPKLDAVTAMIFSVIRQQIDFDNKKYEETCEKKAVAGARGAEYGKLGGRPKRTQKTPCGVMKTVKTGNGVSKTPKTPESESDTDNESDISPLFISPQSGDKKNSFEDEFFATYPRYAKDRDKMREDVDFKKLLDEFAKSSYLRSLYTVGQINDNYALIVAGDFRDKEKPVDTFLAGIEYRAKRERFYSARRSAAESKASAIKNRFMQDETFREIEQKLNALVVKLVKAELQADAGDEKGKKEFAKLKAEESKLLQKRLDILERNGMSEEDLLPKYTCRKCNDTGYTEDGKPCDCYEE